MNACRPAFTDVADVAVGLAAAAAVAVVDEPAAVGRTDATATVVDAGVVEAVAAAVGSVVAAAVGSVVVAVLVDAAVVAALAVAVPPDALNVILFPTAAAFDAANVQRGRGGLVHDLSYSNITMSNVTNPIFITSYYPTMPTSPTADPGQAVTTTTPEWQNITIKNVTATGGTTAGILWGLPEAKISNLVFDNVKISATAGMEIFHATGISFINGSTVTPKSGAAVTIYDATPLPEKPSPQAD